MPEKLELQHEVIGDCKLCGDEIFEDEMAKHFQDKHNAPLATLMDMYGLVQD